MKSRNDPLSPAQERDAASGLSLLLPEPRSLVTGLAVVLRECLNGFGQKASRVIKSLLFILLLGNLSLPLLAQKSDLVPIGKKGNTYFASDVRVGEAMLKQGDYFIQHVVEGADHVFVFKRAIRRSGYDIEPGKEVARVKCKVEPLGEVAKHSGLRYGTNAAGEKTVEEMHIKGENVRHVF